MVSRVIWLLVFMVLGAGCVSNDASTKKETIWTKADTYVARGSYSEAWTALTSTPPSMREQTRNYLKTHPKVYEAAKESFEPHNLEEMKSKGYKANYFHSSLELIEPLHSLSEQKRAQQNIDRVFGAHAKEVYANTLGKKSDSSSVRYGRVTGVQIVNRSHVNTGSGAQLGALGGQALYIDNTSWQGYSAVNQLGAGILGAIVGSALDEPTRIRYERKYWVTLNDGDTVSVSVMGNDNTHIPEGVCVSVTSGSINTTNESNCKTAKSSK